MNNLQSLFTNLRTHSPRTLLFSILAVLTVFLLAAGLTGLELLPGEPEAFGFVFRRTETEDSQVKVDENLFKVIRILYIVGLVLMPFWLIYIIVNPQARKRFLRDLVTFGSFMLMILMLTSYFTERVQEGEEGEFGGFGGFGEAPTGEVPQGNFGSEPPEAMMWVASVLVALVAVGFLAFVIWLVWRRRRRKDRTLERIAEDVESALDELHAGSDLRNVVIRCYSDMVQALREKRGVYRNMALTPREFEDTLQSMGFPIGPVHQLTSLFESVRYGHKSVTKREELVAVDSLTAILDACRSKG